MSTPRWVVPASLVVCVLGVADSAYLTYEHYTDAATLACSDNGVINCLKVTTSSYATILGVPVALLGLLFFLGMTALCLPQAWRSSAAWLVPTRLVASAVGVVMVLYLVWVELLRVDAICLWCTGVHVLSLALFIIVALAWVNADDTAV